MSLFIETTNGHQVATPSAYLPLEMLQDELSEALYLYWSIAEDILQESGVSLLPASDDYFTLENNFFSALFLYSYQRAEIPLSRRILYAAVNQCLRGMVTGCDNILDDEYKKTLHTDLPEQGWRFRSVLDIMVSDRVLFEILLKWHRKNELTSEQVLAASAASLKALTRSGAQEASEEKGILKILPPEEILQSIHHYKTGLLFQCPWAVPSTIENYDKKSASALLEALYRIGIGCQIMDDMVDLTNDLVKKRHNYIISLIFYGTSDKEKNRLEAMMVPDKMPKNNSTLLQEFPSAQQHAVKTAYRLLQGGLKVLFSSTHQFLVAPTISFLAKQIGADGFMSGIEQ
jgi:hypothetical protein